ncbi:MAG: HD domain-containing phosphohydrolase [Desulfovibrionales bacterium]
MKHGEKKSKILVVDDETSLREICQDALEDAGYTVYQAKNGQDALDFLSGSDVDLIISDLRMPVLNGLELLQEVKAGGKDSAFLVMTGFGTIETAVESMKMGASDYLPKPFNINHLLLKVEKVLKDRQILAERRKLSNLVRMLNLSNALNSQLDLKSLINEFLFHLQKNFSPDAAVLFLLDEKGGDVLTPSAVRGDLLQNHSVMNRIREISTGVMADGHSKLLDGTFIASHSGKQQPSGHNTEGFGRRNSSLMVVPLENKLKKIGIVALIRETANERYSASELQLLTVFASHTASSLENARLYGQMHSLNMQVIRSYAKAVEAKDIYTRGHSDRVALYAIKLGHRLGLPTSDLDQLYTAGVLHDIGKIGIPDQILNKPSPLTDEEYAVMKKHPEIGQAILSKVESLDPILSIIYHHHERMDGRGYPSGLSGAEIPFLARIVSVVDSFEAMTSDRAYRNALSQEKVVSILEKGAGTQWDKDLVAVWLEIVQGDSFDQRELDLSSEKLVSSLFEN